MRVVAITDQNYLFVPVTGTCIGDKDICHPIQSYRIASPPPRRAFKSPVFKKTAIYVGKPLTLDIGPLENDQRREGYPIIAHTLQSSDPFAFFDIFL